jgi:hypothetical protein
MKIQASWGWLVLFALAPTAGAATWQVGPTRQYKNLMAVYNLVAAGDTIEVDAGVYPDDVVVWRANNLTVRGVNGRAHVQGTKLIPFISGNDQANGKGFWVVNGSGLTVENFEFSGAQVGTQNGANGAGIRIQAGGLTIRNCYFHNNENGILGGGGTLTIENSEFAFNGFGDGSTHNIYVDTGNVLIFRNSYSHHAKIGHNLKSRTKETYVLYSRLMDEASGTSSYIIDIPNGGLGVVVGNLIQQGPQSPNSGVVAYAQEIYSDFPHPVQELYVVNNTFVNDAPSGTFVTVRSTATTSVRLTNNIFVGPGSQTNFAGATKLNNLTDSGSSLVSRSGYDYRLVAGSPAINAGTSPGATSAGYSLTPTFHYLHPLSAAIRPADAVLDVGAYEFGTGGGTLPPPNAPTGLRVK